MTRSIRRALLDIHTDNMHIYLHIYIVHVFLSCVACACSDPIRAKIQACVARGGRPDPDAPNDPESTRYRVSMEMEEKELWQQENEMSMHTNLDCRSAVRVMSMADPAVSTVHAPDPMALVRDQLQNLQQAVAPPTPSQQPSNARAGRWLSEKFSCTCPCTACMQEAKRKPSQRVQQEALLRALVSRMWPWPGKPLMRSSVWHVASSAPSDLQSTTSTSDGNITHAHTF